MDDLNRSLLLAMRALAPEEFASSLDCLRRTAYWSADDESDLQVRIARLREQLDSGHDLVRAQVEV